MKMRIGLLALASSVISWAETPIPQPNSWGLDLNGPALQLACVADLKRLGEEKFVGYVKAKSPRDRVGCVRELLQSATPEPEFTAEDYFEWWKQPPDNSDRSRKMQDRLGVNVTVSTAVLALAKAKLIEDKSAIASLIQCLAHPLLEVSRVCEGSLVTLTRHSYGWDFYDHYPRIPPTFESRQRMIGEWSGWNRQMKDGVTIFDDALQTECLDAISATAAALARVFEGSVGASYLSVLAAGRPSLNQPEAGPPGVLYQWEIGSIAANWNDRSTDRIAIVLKSPGLKRLRTDAVPGDMRFFPPAAPDGNSKNYVYAQTFPALDLELSVKITTKDPFLPRRCYNALLEGSDPLRRANDSMHRR